MLIMNGLALTALYERAQKASLGPPQKEIVLMPLRQNVQIEENVIVLLVYVYAIVHSQVLHVNV